MGSNPAGKTSSSSRQTQVVTKTEMVSRARKPVEPQQVTESQLDGLEERIRELAYEKWEAAGRPAGDGTDFWVSAELEIRKPR